MLEQMIDGTNSPGYLAVLHKYANTKDVFYLRKTADRMSGFVNHYVRIPGMAHNEVPALKRWCKNRWKAIAGKKLFFDQTWFLIKAKPVNKLLLKPFNGASLSCTSRCKS